MINCGAIVKKPLLYSLFIWLVLLALPATRGGTILDWKSATLTRLSDSRPEWAPLDRPFQSDVYLGTASLLGSEDSSDEPKAPLVDGQSNGLTVAPQFASVARTSSDRDVLVWCARTATDSKAVARNLLTLNRRFPGDAALLAWTCGAQMDGLSLTTRVPGPLTSSNVNWSVRSPDPAPTPTPSAPVSHLAPMYPVPPVSSPPVAISPLLPFKIERNQRSQWEALATQARQGERLEPSNGFWWWLEATALLGARRDAQVWSVLHIGGSKPLYDAHTQELVTTLRRAHLKTLGTIPYSYYLSYNDNSFEFYSRWREVTRQVSENVMGERLQGHHARALNGGLDMVLMGKMLRSSNVGLHDEIAVLVGIAVERIALQSALPPYMGTVRRLPPNASVQAFAGHPRSLLRYANEQHRSDITGKITKEWQALGKAWTASAARIRKTSTTSTMVEGVDDSVLALAAGAQNTGTLFVQTLPIPLLALALLSLPALVLRRQEEPFPLPSWKRGLGWSAFALFILVFGQALLAHVGWANTGFLTPKPWIFDFMVPRLVVLLPIWAFAFAACVAGVGALWTTMFAARRARGDASLIQRLRLVFNSPDDHVGVVNLEPLVQIIAVIGAWGLTVAILGLWFYLPQKNVQSSGTGTIHQSYAGLALFLFCVVALYIASLFRIKKIGFRAYSVAWLSATRRFLVAHIALTTTLYLLLSIGSLFWSARLDAQWLQANTPTSSTKP